MNRKQLTLLIVLGAVLGGLGLLAWKKQQQPYVDSTQRMGEKLLGEFDLNAVAHITIKQSKGELNLIKKDDAWTVKERGNYAANFANLSELLRKLWEMKIAQPVKVGPSRLPMLELVAPDKGAGTLVELKDAGGKVLKSLLLGAKHTKDAPSSSPFGGGSWPDGRYVMLGGDLKTVALIADPLATAEPKAEDWLNKEFFKVENVKQISLVSTNATNNWTITRESATAEWKLADAKGEEKLDNAKSSGLPNALSFPQFADVSVGAKPEDTGLDKPTTVTLETFDGFTYTTKIGQTNGADNYHFQFDVAGNFPKERTPGKDEKPEDKAKLDKEFADNLKKQQDKLKAEQAYTKWTYLMNKWTVDPLLKPRKDLLAEKKEEPKKDEAKPEEKK